MKCQTVREKLDLYMTQGLVTPVREAVEAHLRTCYQCRQELAGLEQLATLLKHDVAIPPVPESLSYRIMATARQRLSARQSPETVPWNIYRWWSSFSFPMRAAGAATLAAGLLIGILMGQQTWQSVHSSNPPQAVQADPFVVYELDYLTDAPGGSLTQSYLMLTGAQKQNGT
jgi:hypothetical protein